MADIADGHPALFSPSIFQMASVQATSSLMLDIGSWVTEENAATLNPPAVSLFDQIVEWLWRQAPPYLDHSPYPLFRALGIM
jgi:hypothetical protein